VTDQLAALTAFCVNNAELEQLEAMLAEFNVFEAAGLTSQEIRHSRFLSFLLDPKAAHGLGEVFATRLLQAAVHARPPDEVGVTALDLELMDLTDLQVACEVQNIDILLLSAANEFAVVIENKVGSGEHSNQLPRYLNTVEAMKPGWRVLPVLLSPLGVEPTDARYFAISYEKVAEILAGILDSRKASLGPDVSLALRHYERLLRRHVVSDSKLNELCQQIIAKHRKAIELLIEHMGDPKMLAWTVTDRLLEEHGFVRTERRWLPETWLDWIPVSKEAPNGFIVGFWVDVYGKRLRLILEIQPGPTDVRSALFNACQHSAHLRAKRKEMTGQWTRILDYELAPTRQPDADPDAWEAAIRARMSHLAEIVLPEIEVHLKQAIDQPEP
jgi:hypothetical protein